VFSVHLPSISGNDPSQNIFSHPSFSYLYSFATPHPEKLLKLGTAIRWEIITNSKPPGPIIMIDESETLSSS
jgi:hypothetical protein